MWQNLAKPQCPTARHAREPTCQAHLRDYPLLANQKNPWRIPTSQPLSILGNAKATNLSMVAAEELRTSENFGRQNALIDPC
jgi:hypothetical protein